jgi:glycosyltransferase involved in cell wall biosynthesis
MYRTMKVLLVGHACGPDRGSESGVTWNFATHLSREHEVWVFTDPQFREDIEKYLENNPNPRLKFVWISLPSSWDPRRSLNSDKGLRFHYLLWQRAVLRKARDLHRSHKFDVVHHVSWGSISAPPQLWRLPIPFVWGPIGGGQTAPLKFLGYFGRSWHRELIRTFRVGIMPRLPALRKAVRKSALILSTNPETTKVLESAGAADVLSFDSSGIPEELLSIQPVNHEGDRKELTILWAGRLIPLKALSLALEAMAKVEQGLRVRLQVLGDGPLRKKMEKLADNLGIRDRVDFIGAVPWKQMEMYYRGADVFLFTSLRDSFPTVVMEAMAFHLPVLSLNHQGVGSMLPPDAGIKVPVEDPAQTVSALAEGIRDLAKSPELRKRLGNAGWKYAQSLGWDGRAKQVTCWYEDVVKQYREHRAV